MGFSRAQFCALAGFNEDRYKSADRREQLPFIDTSNGQGWTAMHALLLSTFGRFASLPDGQGIDNMRAASIVLNAMPEIDRNWGRIVESGHAMHRGRRNVAEIMVGRAALPLSNAFVDRIYARMNSRNPGAGGSTEEVRDVIKDHFPAVCGTMAEIAQTNGGVIIDLNVTSITRCFAVLLKKADYLKLDLPESFYPKEEKR